MKKVTQTKRSTLVKSGGEAHAYTAWIADLKRRYRATQIKAAVAVNSALIEFYWNLGKDISEKYPGKKRNIAFFANLSRDLCSGLSDIRGLSERNIRYSLAFYELYGYLPQLVADNGLGTYLPQVVADLIRVPWGHHRTIIDKCKRDRDKALFYVRRTIQNGWSRNSLLNWLSTDLYEREGKAQTNFDLTMPSDDCDLARQLVKDPQKFEVFGLSEEYSEKELKAAIVANIESTLPKTFQKLSWSLSSVNHHRKPVDFCYTILTSYVTNHHACRRKPDCHLSAERDRPGACARRTPLLGGGKRN